DRRGRAARKVHAASQRGGLWKLSQSVMRPHAFIAMPFGIKPGPDGTPINFDLVYTQLIKPALNNAGCEAFRADEEPRAGDIRTDMFQELLVADLVVADLTLDNPNVWYELGVRHALRARGVVLVQGPRPYQPFDIYTDRKQRYTLKDGAPDPATVEAERHRLTEQVKATLATSTRRKVSPVYALLPHLEQPQWQRLLLAEANEFSDAYDAWAARMDTARQKNLPGDILVLASETPTRSLALEAQRAAGNALLKLTHYDFALEQFEEALVLDPADKFSRTKKAICLGRLGRPEETRSWMTRLTQDYPTDAEIWALAGRLAKECWIERWRRPKATPAEMRLAARDEDACLTEAIEPYRAAFVTHTGHHYAGINALTLTVLRRHLGGEADDSTIATLAGGVAWACLSAQERDKANGAQDTSDRYWARASYAELCLLLHPLERIKREYRIALAAANRDWFALDSTRQTLLLLRDLEFRPEETAAALALVDREIDRAEPPDAAEAVPRQVLLFSGHMMDAEGRSTPRFPPEKEEAAAKRIAAALDALGAGPQDLALSQAASGGDLLFIEAAQARGVRCQVLLPFEEPEFIDNSVACTAKGEDWRLRYYAAQARLDMPVREMPAALGPLPEDVNAYERCNFWLLNTALAHGTAKVRFICLWNGGGGDGTGGTAHMYREVKRRTGRVQWIDTRTL
ncbi:MAG: tetratricopeptide repeat-containing protein, partial [Burkholderiales bacterium]